MERMTDEQFNGVVRMILKEIEEIHDEESKQKAIEKIKALIDD